MDPRRPPRPARLAVQATKGGVVMAVATMACGIGASVHTQDVTAERDAAEGPSTAQQAHVAHLMAEHRCSASGFGPDVIPGSALVLRHRHVRHVSFDVGWAVYTGDAPGTLLAVCRVNV